MPAAGTTGPLAPGSSSPAVSLTAASRISTGARNEVVSTRRAGRCAVRGGERLGEVGDVLEIGAPEAVDRLVGVGGHRQVGSARDEPPQQRGLGERRVLVLVDEDVAIAIRRPRRGVGG